TITSFAPTCGGTDTVVTITGTNLLGPGQVGAPVRFNPYLVDAGVVQPDADTATSLHRIVPTASGDGPIRVTTFAAAGGQVFSSTNFLVPPPDCAAATGHERAITLKLTKKGKASGVVSSTEDPPFTDCVSAVPVQIQYKPKGSGWKNAGTATTTDTGSYTKTTKGKPGKYRALAKKVAGTTSADDCLKATSPTRTIKK
ncbi:MAG TPA: hypothetical protein VJW23_12970, partial [Propionibacteriaceae bacterium]|nr:hypothetical protein [Propionibacteriaceae bacterium]